MNIPPALAVFLLPAVLITLWLYLHKDADIEERIDKKEKIQQLESAKFDRDFAKITGNKIAETEADSSIKDSEKQLKDIQQQKKKRQEKDQRDTVRAAVDDLIRADQINKSENKP